MKKIIALLLTLCLALTLFGCAQAPADNKQNNDQNNQVNNENKDDTNNEGNDNTDEVTVMTYEEFMAAEVDDIVTIESYVQATQGWWDNTIVIYLQGTDGAYFSYGTKCSEEDAAKLVPGTKVRITGTKAEFNGEVEIMDGEFEFVEGADTYVAEAMDATALLGTDDLIKHMNKKVCFKGVTVAAANDEGAAFLYKWDGSGAAGDDLYFNVTVGDATYGFCVESYLAGDGTDVYEAVEALKVGDVIDVEGFLYWYEGAQPHVTVVTAAA